MSRKKQIIETATDLFSRYNHITMHDVAKSVGMKKSSIYRYAKNKDDLFDKCLRASELAHMAGNATDAQIVILARESLRTGQFKRSIDMLTERFGESQSKFLN